MLTEAAPETVRLCVAMGGSRRVYQTAVDRLRRAGHVIEGVRPAGYRLVSVHGRRL